ncbi:hypothetical protein Tco_0484507 [Tanacetum coccineum]
MGQNHKSTDTSSSSGNVDMLVIQRSDPRNEEPMLSYIKKMSLETDLQRSFLIRQKETRVQTKDQNDSLMAQLNKKSKENADVLAQIQKKRFAIAALKNELRKLTGNSVNTKFAKPSILGKPVGQPLKNQSVVRQLTAFKSERPRISKPRFASQVDVNNDLSKPVTTHYLLKRRESALAKPHYMIAPSSSRYSSNDIVHNHYVEEAKKKTHEHFRIPRNFSDSKHFVCSTCQKCVFNANHDACVIKFLKEVNSRAKVPSNKTTNRNKPVEQIRVATKPKRQIPKGHRFSIKKTTTVHEKTTSPRSCLRWQPTGRILKTVCLRWVPTGKTFASSTTKVESEPPNGSNADIPNQCESEQALNVSAGTLLSTAVQASVVNVKWCLLKITLQAPFLNVQMTFEHSRSSLGLHGNDQIKPRSSWQCKQDSYITTRVGITIPPSHSNAEDNSHKVVRLGINPMIQPEPEDLPKDNPKLEIAVLRVILFSIHNDEWKSFQCHHQTALRSSGLSLGTMFHVQDQLEKQLDNEEFQEIGFMAAFKMVPTGKTLPLAYKGESEPTNGSNAVSLTQCESEQALMSVLCYSLKYRYIVQSIQRKESEFGCEKEKISQKTGL